MKSKNDLTQALEDQEKEFEETKELLIKETSDKIWTEFTKKMDEEVKWLKGIIDEWDEELWQIKKNIDDIQNENQEMREESKEFEEEKSKFDKLLKSL